MQSGNLTEIHCASASPAGGHYAQAMLHRDTLYVSGQLGVTGDTPDAEMVPIAEQVRFALSNIEAIAGVVGANIRNIIRCTVFVTDVEHWPEVNRAYASFFGDHRPARSIVPCGALHYGALVEIEAIVAVGS